MNIRPLLDKHKFRTFSVHGLVTDVREYVEERGTNHLLYELIQTNPHFSSNLEARIWVKKFIVELYNQQFILNQQDIPDLIDVCWIYTKEFINDPKWSFLQSNDDQDHNFGVKVEVLEQKQVVEGISVKVEVKSDGRIKKGGKQVLCEEMFKKYILETDTPMSNKEFLALIMDKLQLSKAGANTYFFNVRKAAGMVRSRGS